MPRRWTNLLLLFLVLALVATGLLGWVLPEPRSFPLYDAHRGLGVALVLLLLWKQRIVRLSLSRRLRPPRWDRSVLAGVLGGVALLGSLALGLAWTLDLVSFRSLWGYSPLNLHVFLALAVLPFLLWHALRRAEPLPPAKLLTGRRTALRLLGLAAASLLSWQALERAASALAAPASRRPSGSKHAGSFSGNDFPMTNWLFDGVPSIDPSAWQLRVAGRVAAPGALGYRELLALPGRQMEAVLDCTGGWWSEQLWQGVLLWDVLAAKRVEEAARAVEVVSVTGHRWWFPLNEVQQALLATHVGGEVLSPGHGYPVRLVVPGRRGFQWVKWVDTLEVL